MIAATFTDTIDDEWLKLQPLRVGIPASLGTPERHLTVTDEGRLVLRVEVYAYGPDHFAFEEAVVWRSNVVIGFGSHVHAVSLAQRDVITVALGSYFGHLYPTGNYLLVASGERLFRMEPDRSIRWRSDALAVDGVVVESPGPEVIHGQGDSDPPGGWKPFALWAANGLPTLQ